MLYIDLRGVRGGIALIFFWKSVFEKHPTDHLQEKMESGKYLKWLKVIGKCIKNMFEKSGRVYYILISEKKVLPSAVLLVAMMYTAIAAIFYFEWRLIDISLFCGHDTSTIETLS